MNATKQNTSKKAAVRREDQAPVKPLSAAEIIDIKGWFIEKAQLTDGVQKQEEFERLLGVLLPAKIMQAVHLLICLQILNTEENVSVTGLTDKGKRLLQRTIASLQLAVDDLGVMAGHSAEIDAIFESEAR